MFVRKPLVLAMLAAGIIASDGLPEAQSTVFVPELAMLDGALCTGTMASTPMMPMLLAQMKTEVSPAAKAAASAAPATAAADQPLIAGLGARSFKVTTSSKQAQQYFDQGLRLAWNFNHAEAQRAFQKAQRFDPECAMCYWGEAYVLGPNINVPMDPSANAPAAAAAAKAKSLAAKATPRVRFISSVYRRSSSCRCSAAQHARCAWSSCAIGAPKRAMMPSPVYWFTVPSKRWTPSARR